MQVLYPRCCGIDIHKKFVVACVLLTTPEGQVQKAVQTFSTMTQDLLALLDWLQTAGCTHVAMESTSSYWRPVYNLLEGQFTVLVGNAYHMKAVPGRKTDVKDAEWIADLLRHGLIRGSFIPTPAQRQLRDLTRYRTHLVEERARLTNRLQMVLEDANVKLASVVTDIRGASARAMLAALVAGETEPTVLADLAQGRMRSKREVIAQAVVGRFTAHHAFLLTEHLSQLDYLEDAITRVSAEITQRLAAEQEALALLDTIPGVGQQDLRGFPAPNTWPRGQGCVRATPRAAASGSVARPAKAIPGCAMCCLRWPMPPVRPRTRTCQPSIAAWQRGGASNER